MLNQMFSFFLSRQKFKTSVEHTKQNMTSNLAKKALLSSVNIAMSPIKMLGKVSFYNFSRLTFSRERGMYCYQQATKTKTM